MIVRAKKGCQDLLAASFLRRSTRPSSVYISDGTIYVVYGIGWGNAKLLFGETTAVEILDDFGNLTTAPMELFEIICDQVYEGWRVRLIDDSVICWPELFFQKYFFDDLSEGVPEVVAAFKNLRANIDRHAQAVTVKGVGILLTEVVKKC